MSVLLVVLTIASITFVLGVFVLLSIIHLADVMEQSEQERNR